MVLYGDQVDKSCNEIFPEDVSDIESMMTINTVYKWMPIIFYTIEILIWIVLTAWAYRIKRMGGVTSVFITLMTLSSSASLAYYSTMSFDFYCT